MSLRVVRTVAELRAACDELRRVAGQSARRAATANETGLGVVPTMGALHEGHRALVRKARELCTSVVVTIFVNPTQFGPKEDFSRYPRDLDNDIEQCRREDAALVFAPPVAEMYAPNERTRVRVAGLTEALCGASRPGHFDGVATVVTKLFAAIGPCTAVFGRKDYQQLKVIERLVRDLILPVRIVGHPTVREADGLAMSSRNRYLTEAERAQALAIPRALSDTVSAFRAGERNAGALRLRVESALRQAGLGVDYVTVADAEELVPISDESTIAERALLAIAALCGSTRLIDNVVLGEDDAPSGRG